MKTKYILIPLLSLLLASCHKDKPSPSIDLNVFNQSDFPIKAGDSWTYKRYDSISHQLDTITWSIPDMTIVNGKSVYLWLQSSSGMVDSGYISVNNDTISYFTYANTFPKDYLIFPLAKDTSWTIVANGGSPDQYSAIGAQDITVNGTLYNNTFALHRLSTGFALQYEDVNLARGIGIIYYHFHSKIGLANTTYTLSLISYTIR